jgi:hypothetical protein
MRRHTRNKHPSQPICGANQSDPDVIPNQVTIPDFDTDDDFINWLCTE